MFLIAKSGGASEGTQVMYKVSLQGGVSGVLISNHEMGPFPLYILYFLILKPSKHIIY